MHACVDVCVLKYHCAHQAVDCTLPMVLYNVHMNAPTMLYNFVYR